MKELLTNKKPRDRMGNFDLLKVGMGVGILVMSVCHGQDSFAKGRPESEKMFTIQWSYKGGLNGKAQKAEPVLIEGTVRNKKGERLTGVTILSKEDSKIGTKTDDEGHFSIRVADHSTLIVRHVNYRNLEIPVQGTQKNLEIVLDDNDIALDQVVVVGFGTTSVKKNSTAIASFDAKTIENLPFGDMGSALQGRIPGVIVQQGSAEPGQNGASISIRGNGTPLYVIDGFISTQQQFFSLNKADIKSMTILKDAASTAVYGMNAGNGVVLITTKQGDSGKLNVNYQANFGFNTPSYQTKRMDAYQYATAINNLNQALGMGINSFKTPEEMEDIKNNLGNYTNWEKELTRRFVPQQDHTLSLNGGSEKLRFFGSLNAFSQEGIYKAKSLNYHRYTYRSNVSSNFDKIGLKLDFNVNGYIRNEDYPPASAYTIYSRLRDRNPFEKPFTSSGQISNQFDNPALALLSPGYIKLKTVYNQLSGALNWNVPWVEGLSLGFNGNFNIESQDRVDWVETATYYDEQGNATKEDPTNISVGRSFYMTQNFDVNFRADYRRTFGDGHNVEATLVQNMRQYNSNALNAGSRGFYTTAIKQIQKGDAELITASNTEGKQAWMGYVGKFHYDYKQRYIFDFAGRYDGSDNFISTKRWGFFPSFSAGWALSEENFFKDIKAKNVLTYLKLRGSYGQIGLNDADHWAYAYLATYNYNTNGYVVDG